MQSTYITATTSGTTPATVINSDGRQVVVRKILIGNPTGGATLTLFTENNALANNTTQIGFGMTYPSFSTTNVNSNVPAVIDFRTNTASGGSTEEDGLICQGGASLSQSSNMQVTVFWDYAQG